MKTNFNDQAKQEYRSYLRTRAMTEELKPQLKSMAKEMEDLEQWTITFGSDQRVMIMRYNTENKDKPANLADFTRIRAAVEAIFDIKMVSELSGFLGEGHEFIQAKGDITGVPWRHGTFSPSIEIRMFGIDKCEVEYVEEVVRKPKLTGFCAEVLD